MTRAVGSEPKRRVLTEELRRYFEFLLGKGRVDEVLALGAEKAISISILRSKDAERQFTGYQGLKEKGLYAECIEMAGQNADESTNADRHLESAMWRAYEFSCLRNLGRLEEALGSGVNALRSLHSASASQRSHPEALLLQLRLEFGITISSLTMQSANFAAGLIAHKNIARRGLTLIRRFQGTAVAGKAHSYVLHARRQQAECLRYLGRYRHALRDALRVENDYPLRDVQPRFWAGTLSVLRREGGFHPAARMMERGAARLACLKGALTFGRAQHIKADVGNSMK